MRYTNISTFFALAFLSKTAHALPNLLPAVNLVPRSVSYSIVNVDGGATTAMPITTILTTVIPTQSTLRQTVVKTVDGEVPPPATKVVFSTAYTIPPPSTDIIVSMTIITEAPPETTVVVPATSTILLSQITAKPHRPSRKLSSATISSVNTVEESIPTKTGKPADPIVVVPSSLLSSMTTTESYDNGMWHTQYAATAMTTTLSGTLTISTAYYNDGMWRPSHSASTFSTITTPGFSSATTRSGAITGLPTTSQSIKSISTPVAVEAVSSSTAR